MRKKNSKQKAVQTEQDAETKIEVDGSLVDLERVPEALGANVEIQGEIEGGADSLQLEVEEMRLLRRKFKRLYDEVRVRINGFAILDGQIKAACGILSNTLSKYSGTETTGSDDNGDEKKSDD